MLKVRQVEQVLKVLLDLKVHQVLLVVHLLNMTSALILQIVILVQEL